MDKNFISLDSSILYRCNAKYYDRYLSEYEIGYAQLIFLTMIYENEGLSMNDLVVQGAFDKGTVTKSLQKLVNVGYITIAINENDKRNRMIFLTKKARKILPDLYNIKNNWWDYIAKDLDEKEKELYLKLNNKIINRAIKYDSADFISGNKIKVYDYDKLNLIDYPGKIALSLDVGLPVLKYPYADKKILSFLDENKKIIDLNDVLTFIDDQNYLSGFVIKGGEIFTEPMIKQFIKKLKTYNFPIKIITFGLYPKELKELIDENLIDSVRINILNDQQHYNECLGVEKYDTLPISKSVRILKESNIDYEFSLVLTKDFHKINNIKSIARWLNGTKKLIVYRYVDNDESVQTGIESLSIDTFDEYVNTLKQSIDIVEIGGF